MNCANLISEIQITAVHLTMTKKQVLFVPDMVVIAAARSVHLFRMRGEDAIRASS